MNCVLGAVNHECDKLAVTHIHVNLDLHPQEASDLARDVGLDRFDIAAMRPLERLEASTTENDLGALVSSQLILRPQRRLLPLLQVSHTLPHCSLLSTQQRIHSPSALVRTTYI